MLLAIFFCMAVAPNVEIKEKLHHAKYKHEQPKGKQQHQYRIDNNPTEDTDKVFYAFHGEISGGPLDHGRPLTTGGVNPPPVGFGPMPSAEPAKEMMP
jgi:hypothetical protein